MDLCLLPATTYVMLPYMIMFALCGNYSFVSA